MVRNEADIIRTNLLHHFSLGIEHFLIVDNGSSDGTDAILQEMAGSGRLSWTRYSGPYRQAAVMTELAREAFLRGADWVIPIDADELWWTSEGSLTNALIGLDSAGVEVDVINFIQKREQVEASRDALLTMTRRVATPVGPLSRVAELVEANEIAFVEMCYPSKWISRASLAIDIARGNHLVRGVEGELAKVATICCLHAPLRSRSILESKADDFGQRFRQLNAGQQLGWHVQRWARLREEGRLDEEWSANSYLDEALDVYGSRHPVIFDGRLRDAVARSLREGGDKLFPSPRFRPPLTLRRIMEDDSSLDLDRREAGTEEEARLAMERLLLRMIAAPRTVLLVGDSVASLASRLRASGSAVTVSETVEDLPSPDSPFEVVVGGDMIARVEDPLAFVRGSMRYLDEDGVLLLSAPNAMHANVRLAILAGRLPDVGNRYARFHSRESLDRFLVEAGLATVALERVLRRFDGGGSLSAVADLTLQDPEASTYFFVVAAKRAGEQTANLDARTFQLESVNERMKRGIDQLFARLAADARDHDARVAGRDATIVALQSELMQKVGERDTIIRELQSELHQKVGERDGIIRDLQAELHQKVGQRDEMIRQLQGMLSAGPEGENRVPYEGSDDDEG